MKAFFYFSSIFCTVLFFAGNTCAQGLRRSPAQLDAKIRKAEARFETIQGDRMTRIPEFVLRDALGLIIVQQFKAGIGLGAEGGGGVAIVKNPTTGQWSPPAFVANAEGSYGWQIGAQNAITVFCIMQPEGLRVLQDAGLKMGIDVRATAGPASAGGEAVVDEIDSPVLVYSTRKGLFAGVAFEGGGLIQADRKNETYYGMPMQDVLFSGLAKWTPSGASLVNKVRAYAGER